MNDSTNKLTKGQKMNEVKFESLSIKELNALAIKNEIEMEALWNTIKNARVK